MRTFLQRNLTVANVVATMAVIVATTGTAFAAASYTGASVRDGSLSSADVKASSLATADLQAAFRRSLVGPAGTTGRTGSTGAKGSVGPKGPTGPVGDPANVRSSFASWDAGYIDTTAPGLNSGGVGWSAWEWGGGCAAPDCHLEVANAGNAITLNGGAGGTTVIDLDATAPAGGFGGNAGHLTTAWQQSTYMAWGNVTLMYRTEDDQGAGDGMLHTRAECWMTINGAVAGPSVQVSAGKQRELETIALVGNVVLGPGTYDAGVQCRDADATAGRTRWQAVRANLAVMANEKV